MPAVTLHCIGLLPCSGLISGLIGNSLGTGAGPNSRGHGRPDGRSGDRRLPGPGETNEDGVARGEDVNRSPACRRLLNNQRRERFGEQGPLHLATIAAEYEKKR